MTFQEAKDQIAKKHGWNGWRGFITGYQVGLGVTFEQMVDEAAELYAESRAKDAWDKCYELTKETTLAIGLKAIAPKSPYQP